MGANPDIEIVEVPATVVDIHPKYTCFVHRDHRYYEPVGSPRIHNRPHYYSEWKVSETSTGATITTGRTRKEAIENAKNKLKEVGDIGMQIAINTYLTRYPEILPIK